MKPPGMDRRSRRAALQTGALVGLCMAVLCSSPAWAQLPEETLSFRSVSGQFVTQAIRPLGPATFNGELETNSAYVRLDPKLVPVSCERIKQHVWRELGITGPWKNKILLGIVPGLPPEAGATVTTELFRTGWSYRIDFPELIERTVYVRSVVQACLQEYANRYAGVRSAEIPVWLIEALTQQVLTSSEVEVILPPPPSTGKGVLFTAAFIDSKRINSLEEVHQALKNSAGLSFDELSWPGREAFTGSYGERYRHNALFFLKSLQGLKDGRASLRATLELLPQYYNWQFAFLQAFKQHFQRPLDVEKWWSLRLTHFTSRELNQVWPLPETLDKLDEALKCHARVFANTNELPARSEVPLQTVVRSWQPADQTAAFQRALLALHHLRVRAAREAVPVIDGYSIALREFLQAQEQAGRRKETPKAALEKTLTQLDLLEAQVRSLRLGGQVRTDLADAITAGNPAVTPTVVAPPRRR